jgi:hypothetical protein
MNFRRKDPEIGIPNSKSALGLPPPVRVQAVQEGRQKPALAKLRLSIRRSPALLALGLISLSVCGAQQSAKPPLVISNVSQQGATVSFDLTNASRKPIRADVIACTLRGETPHSAVLTVQQTSIYGLGPDLLVAPAFDVGLTHHEQFGGIPGSRSGKAHSCSLSVDYVLFTDGTEWGPDTRNSSRAIRGVIAGYNRAVLGLQRKLQQNGADAVLQYIREFKPIH